MSTTQGTPTMRSRRVRTSSSLTGMMLGGNDEATGGANESFAHRSAPTTGMRSHSNSLLFMLSSASINKEDAQSSFTGVSRSDQEDLKELSRKLRRAKRKLFLKSTERPTTSVDQLRDILLQLSVNSVANGNINDGDDDGSNTSYVMYRRDRSSSILTDEGEESSSFRYLDATRSLSIAE